MRTHSKLYRRARLASPALVVVLLSLSAPGTAAAADSRLSDRNGAGPSVADTQLTFGEWTIFSFGSAGGGFQGSFVFSSPHPMLLRVTDGLCRGDRLRVYDRGKAILLTSKVAIDPSCDDIPLVRRPGAAWRDQSYSKGRFLLQPGWHRIQIQAEASPFGGGGGWLKVVPMPLG